MSFFLTPFFMAYFLMTSTSLYSTCPSSPENRSLSTSPFLYSSIPVSSLSLSMADGVPSGFTAAPRTRAQSAVVPLSFSSSVRLMPPIRQTIAFIPSTSTAPRITSLISGWCFFILLLFDLALLNILLLYTSVIILHLLPANIKAQ